MIQRYSTYVRRLMCTNEVVGAGIRILLFFLRYISSTLLSSEYMKEYIINQDLPSSFLENGSVGCPLLRVGFDVPRVRFDDCISNRPGWLVISWARPSSTRAMCLTFYTGTMTDSRLALTQRYRWRRRPCSRCIVEDEPNRTELGKRSALSRHVETTPSARDGCSFVSDATDQLAPIG